MGLRFARFALARVVVMVDVAALPPAPATADDGPVALPEGALRQQQAAQSTDEGYGGAQAQESAARAGDRQGLGEPIEALRIHGTNSCIGNPRSGQHAITGEYASPTVSEGWSPACAPCGPGASIERHISHSASQAPAYD
jgi:hypothetical protein